MMVGLAGLGQDDHRGQAGAPPRGRRARARASWPPTSTARPPSTSSRRWARSSTVPVYADRTTNGRGEDRQGRHRAGHARPRPRGDRRHRRPAADRRRADGRAQAPQGGDQARRDPARGRRHDRSGSGARSRRASTRRSAITGVILTKLDGDARGGAALSIYGVTQEADQVHRRGREDRRARGVPPRAHGRSHPADGRRGVARGEGAGGVRRTTRRRSSRRRCARRGWTSRTSSSAMRQMQKLGPMENLLKMVPGREHARRSRMPRWIPSASSTSRRSCSP